MAYARQVLRGSSGTHAILIFIIIIIIIINEFHNDTSLKQNFRAKKHGLENGTPEKKLD